MTAFRPIEIVGGGLAGLSLGLALRRAGVEVTLFEAGAYPRHRVCGEFIAGLSALTRARLQLDAFLGDATPNREVAWFAFNRRTRVHHLPTPALGLSRYALDQRLADAFAAAGGDLRLRTRISPCADAPGRVIANGRRRAAPRWIGLKLHARHLDLAHDLEVHLGAHAYVGLARIESGTVNICGLFGRQSISANGPGLLLAYLRGAGLAPLADRIGQADIDSSSFTAVAALDFDGRVPRTPEVRLGDACAVIPPFTGNGMAMAFESAHAALDPLLAYSRGRANWTDTRRIIQAALQRQFRLRLASARALHPFLLKPRRQRCLTLLNRTRLLPLRPLYAVLH